ncbi:hypothetical protein D9M72_339330 [compost metagenome]
MVFGTAGRTGILNLPVADVAVGPGHLDPPVLHVRIAAIRAVVDTRGGVVRGSPRDDLAALLECDAVVNVVVRQVKVERVLKRRGLVLGEVPVGGIACFRGASERSSRARAHAVAAAVDTAGAAGGSGGSSAGVDAGVLESPLAVVRRADLGTVCKVGVEDFTHPEGGAHDVGVQRVLAGSRCGYGLSCGDGQRCGSRDGRFGCGNRGGRRFLRRRRGRRRSG